MVTLHRLVCAPGPHNVAAQEQEWEQEREREQRDTFCLRYYESADRFLIMRVNRFTMLRSFSLSCAHAAVGRCCVGRSGLS